MKGTLDTSPEAQRGRFRHFMHEDMRLHGYRTIRAYAAAMDVSVVYLTSIHGGHKNVSLSILTKAVINRKCNVNWILTGIGEIYSGQPVT